MQEGGAQVVKLEGGMSLVPTVRRLTEQGVPVCAHLGLLPQSVHQLGGYRFQGRDPASSEADPPRRAGNAERGCQLAVAGMRSGSAGAGNQCRINNSGDWYRCGCGLRWSGAGVARSIGI